jgi:hypothetical protein
MKAKLYGLVVSLALLAGGFLAYLRHERRTALDAAADPAGSSSRPGAPVAGRHGSSSVARRPPPALPVVETAEPQAAILLDERAGPGRAIWHDPERDPTFASAFEPAIDQLAARRLADFFPDAVWLGARCQSRTCEIQLEAPVVEEQEVEQFLGLLLTLDGIACSPERGAVTGEMRSFTARFAFPDDVRTVDALRNRQLEYERRYPELFSTFRGYLADRRGERSR